MRKKGHNRRAVCTRRNDCVCITSGEAAGGCWLFSFALPVPAQENEAMREDTHAYTHISAQRCVGKSLSALARVGGMVEAKGERHAPALLTADSSLHGGSSCGVAVLVCTRLAIEVKASSRHTTRGGRQDDSAQHTAERERGAGVQEHARPMRA